jgi:hypothetical protein
MGVDEETKRPRSKRQTLVQAVLFLFCAIPGLALFFVYGGALIGHFIDPDPYLPGPVRSVAGTAAGLLLMLVGVGKWKKWGYLLVFLSLPASLFLYGWLAPPEFDNTLFLAVFALVCTFATNRAVRKYYGRGQSSPQEPAGEPGPISEVPISEPDQTGGATVSPS